MIIRTVCVWIEEYAHVAHLDFLIPFLFDQCLSCAFLSTLLVSFGGPSICPMDYASFRDISQDWMIKWF